MGTHVQKKNWYMGTHVQKKIGTWVPMYKKKLVHGYPLGFWRSTKKAAAPPAAATSGRSGSARK
jgi:hypothetical protein